MSRESNKEIDVLLRRLSGKRNGNSAADNNSAAGVDDHLDTDELNAYAEQALPAATRARYTAHLADCNRCRNLVTQLSLSSTAAVSVRAEEKPSALKTFLASLFSPLVLRYAVPAMAIVVVVALAWIGMRRSASRMAPVARNIEQQPTGTLNSADQRNAASEPTIATGQVESQRTAVAKQETDKEAENKQARVGEEQAAAAPPPVATPAEVERSIDDLAKRPRPSEPPAAPTVGGATSVKPGTEADKNEGARQKKDESAVARDAKMKEEDRAYQAAPQTAATGAAKTQGLESQSEKAAKSRAARREAQEVERAQNTEVRSVGGHRFERRADVWVDVLYESQPTINVSRGSEQYRALIGDEPGIRTIAEQLSGDLIVVWKSRAYRIR